VTQSLFSHASGTADALPAVIADWIHLLAMALWIGGLVQLVGIIRPLRETMPLLAAVVARFSNMARISVMMLVITGLYAAWLHIGTTVEGWFNTPYGQAMIVKLAL